MRVLWFTNCLVPQAYRAFGVDPTSHGGGWMGALLDALTERCPELSLCIASCDSVWSIERKAVGNVEFIRFPVHRRLETAITIVEQWRPDLIHVHGSEGFYGEVAMDPKMAQRTIISLQGLVGPYSAWPAWFGVQTPWEILRTDRILEWLVGRGTLFGYYRFKRGVSRECKALSSVQHVMGRTDFDRAYSTGINPGINYHYVGELLRGPFWQRRWELAKCQRNSVIFTNAGHPRKGVEVLLDAMRIVRRTYAEAQLRVAGAISTRSGYGRSARRKMEMAGVQLLGSLDAVAMTQALCDAHVFVSPSFIDNSPNAVCEAQLVGTPVVATYVGGVPSLVCDRQTGLLAPAGDPSLLSMRIMEVLRSDDLARSLSDGAREVAAKRHDPDVVVGQLLASYAAAGQSAEHSKEGRLNLPVTT